MFDFTFVCKLKALEQLIGAFGGLAGEYTEITCLIN